MNKLNSKNMSQDDVNRSVYNLCNLYIISHGACCPCRNIARLPMFGLRRGCVNLCKLDDDEDDYSTLGSGVATMFLFWRFGFNFFGIAKNGYKWYTSRVKHLWLLQLTFLLKMMWVQGIKLRCLFQPSSAISGLQAKRNIYICGKHIQHWMLKTWNQISCQFAWLSSNDPASTWSLLQAADSPSHSQSDLDTSCTIGVSGSAVDVVDWDL